MLRQQLVHAHVPRISPHVPLSADAKPVRIPDLQTAARITTRFGVPFLLPLHRPPHIARIATLTGLVAVTAEGDVSLTPAGVAATSPAAAEDLFAAAEAQLRREMFLDVFLRRGGVPEATVAGLQRLIALRKKGIVTETEYCQRVDQTLEHVALAESEGCDPQAALGQETLSLIHGANDVELVLQPGWFALPVMQRMELLREKGILTDVEYMDKHRKLWLPTLQLQADEGGAGRAATALAPQSAPPASPSSPAGAPSSPASPLSPATSATPTDGAGVRGAAPPASTAVSGRQRLDAMRDQGVISPEEYNTRRLELFRRTMELVTRAATELEADLSSRGAAEGPTVSHAAGHRDTGGRVPHASGPLQPGLARQGPGHGLPLGSPQPNMLHNQHRWDADSSGSPASGLERQWDPPFRPSPTSPTPAGGAVPSCPIPSLEQYPRPHPTVTTPDPGSPGAKRDFRSHAEFHRNPAAPDPMPHPESRPGACPSPNHHRNDSFSPSPQPHPQATPARDCTPGPSPQSTQRHRPRPDWDPRWEDPGAVSSECGDGAAPVGPSSASGALARRQQLDALLSQGAISADQYNTQRADMFRRTMQLLTKAVTPQTESKQ